MAEVNLLSFNLNPFLTQSLSLSLSLWHNTVLFDYSFAIGIPCACMQIYFYSRNTKMTYTTFAKRCSVEYNRAHRVEYHIPQCNALDFPFSRVTSEQKRMQHIFFIAHYLISKVGIFLYK